MEWTGNGMEMEWTGKGKKDKSEEWEDEWIMIPPTPLKPPVACDDWPCFFIKVD